MDFDFRIYISLHIYPNVLLFYWKYVAISIKRKWNIIKKFKLMKCIENENDNFLFFSETNAMLSFAKKNNFQISRSCFYVNRMKYYSIKLYYVCLKSIARCNCRSRCCSSAAIVWNIWELGAKKQLLTTKQLIHLS